MAHVTKNGRSGDRDPNQKPVVILSDVSKHYRQGTETVKAVDKVFLQVEPGDFLVITGRSGSGKTTLLSLVGGLTNPTTGSVMVFDKSLTTLDDDTISSLRAERISFVFQFASLIPTLTALDNVRMPGLFARKPVGVDEAKELLSWVGLADKQASYPAQLSGGQQTRVAVARALANKPDLLLADEPTGNLDIATEQEILYLLREMNLKWGMTLLLVTHNPQLASFGNRHVVMTDGRLQPVFQQPQVETVVDE